ncbi:MAG: mercuric reductase MerA [Gemmatimonadota bacterium]
MAHDSSDLVVLGAGSAGFAAAIRAAEEGAAVTLVHHGTLGGTCVNVGCVPSKTLIRAADARHARLHHPFDGVSRSGEPVDWARVRNGKDELVSRLRQAKYADVLDAYPGIALVEGRARLARDGSVVLPGDRILRAGATVITTGSRPEIPAIEGLGTDGFLDSTGLLDVEVLPPSLAVLGAGPVALELAQAYARFGVDVTVIARSRLLSRDDIDIGRELAVHLRSEGVSVVESATVVRIERGEAMRRVVLRGAEGGESVVEAAEILVATGRRPNTADMGLAEAGIRLGPRGQILVDETLRTANARVWAAGDVTGEPMHVYVAARAGGAAAANALGGEEKLDLSVLPQVTFTDPGVATVGLTEAQARERGLHPIVSRLPLEHVPRALAARDTRGFIKLVAEAGSRRILGAQIVAREAWEVIMEPALAVRVGLTIDDLSGTLHPYLTLAEGVRLAALAFSKKVEKMSCCAA